MTAEVDGHSSTPISRTAAASGLTPSALGPAAPIDAEPAARNASAESIIRHLFAISMTLASCAKTTDGHAARRVMEAIDGLDHVISDLRTAIFDESEVLS